MTRELAYQAAIAFFLIVTVGLFVIAWREHRAPEVIVEATTASAPAPACVPPMSHWQFKQRSFA